VNRGTTKIVRRRRTAIAENDKFEKLRQVYLKVIEEKYVLLYPELLDLNEWQFDDLFLLYLKGSDEELLSNLEQVHPGIFRFSIFKEEFCVKLMQEVYHFEQWCLDHGLSPQRPNSMNNYGAILDDFGFRPVLEAFVQKYMNRLSKVAYPHIGDTLDGHHGFTVSYEIGKDTNLSFHKDDSEVTLNVCLGDRFTGGDLFFGGVRCETHQQIPPTSEESIEIAHEIGMCLLHEGRHRHLATDITSGTRNNLILWCTSSNFRANLDHSICSSWCSIQTQKQIK